MRSLARDPRSDAVRERAVPPWTLGVLAALAYAAAMAVVALLRGGLR